LSDAEGSPQPRGEALAGAGGRDIAAEVIALLADKTGYRAETLDPCLELEAHLGIDPVQQALLLAIVRHRYGIERDDSFKQHDHPTVGDVIGYVEDHIGGGATDVGDEVPSSEFEVPSSPLPRVGPPAAGPNPVGKPDDADWEAAIVEAIQANGPAPALTWCLSEIPPTKLRNARTAADVPDHEVIWVLRDLTLFGSARNCLLVGTEGIYGKLGGSDGWRISYDQLDRGGPVVSNDNSITFEGRTIFLSGDALWWRQLLDRLRIAIHNREIGCRE
jgi:hypothetical protein